MRKPLPTCPNSCWEGQNPALSNAPSQRSPSSRHPWAEEASSSITAVSTLGEGESAPLDTFSGCSASPIQARCPACRHPWSLGGSTGGSERPQGQRGPSWGGPKGGLAAPLQGVRVSVSCLLLVGRGLGGNSEAAGVLPSTCWQASVCSILQTVSSWQAAAPPLGPHPTHEFPAPTVVPHSCWLMGEYVSAIPVVHLEKEKKELARIQNPMREVRSLQQNIRMC